MPTAKQEVLELLQHLPDDSSFEDIQYNIYVHQKVQKGIHDVEKGRVYTQEDVEKRLEKWHSK